MILPFTYVALFGHNLPFWFWIIAACVIGYGAYSAIRRIRSASRNPWHQTSLLNVYFEWSKPWSRFLRTKLTTNYRLNELKYSIANTDDAELKATMETLLRLGTKSYFVVNLGASRQESVLGQINYSVIPGASINLNLLKFLYLQFDYESNFMIDSTATHLLSTKITGQF